MTKKKPYINDIWLFWLWASVKLPGENGDKYFAHTLNNTCVAPPRMLIAFLENNLQADGSILIPEVLQPYMGGKKKIG